jgi:hypothetical protein
VSLQARQGKANGFLGDNGLLVKGRTWLGFVSTAYSAAHPNMQDALEIWLYFLLSFYYMLWYQEIVTLLFYNFYQN